MDFSSPGNPGQKKTSIFASLAPVSAAASPPVPEPVPEARPVYEEAGASALKQTMDELEKNIVSRLEKKIAEQFRAGIPREQPKPAAPAAGGEALLLKIAELERRLGDFSQQAVLSASQLRNIEESKISARREIEDLLKAVREQQKYSEIDRQIHSQLEKSWVRVEELEKKLMDFYASILALESKRKEDLSSERGRDQSLLLELKDALGAVAGRLEALEQKTGATPALTIQVLRRELDGEFAAEREAAARRQAEFISYLERQAAAAPPALTAQDLSRELERQLSAERQKTAERQEEFFSDMKRQAASSFAATSQTLKESAFSFRAVFENYVAKEMSFLGQKINGEMEALKKESSARLEELKTESSSHAASLKETLARYKAVSAEVLSDFSRAAAENKVKADGIEAALGIFTEKMCERFEAATASMLAGLKKENDERFEKFSGKYSDALASLSFLESFQTAAGGAGEKLAYFARVIGEFMKNADREGLARAAGVSGMLQRESFEAMETALAQLKEEAEKIENIRGSLVSRFKDVFKGVKKHDLP